MRHWRRQCILLGFLYFVVVLIVIPTFSTNRAFSLFYENSNSDSAVIESYKNHHRAIIAEKYFSELNPSVSLILHENNLRKQHIDYLIIIMATRPQEKRFPKLLSQLVYSIDVNLQSAVSLQAAFVICNASDTQDSELKALSDYYVVRNPIYATTSSASKLNSQETFVNCLTLKQFYLSSKYVALIPDTVLPFENFLQTLNSIIKFKLDNIIQRGEVNSTEGNWLFLHLREPMSVRHFWFNFSSMRELIIVASFGAFAFFVFFYLLDSDISKHMLLFLCLFGGFLYLTFAIMFGRPYITALRRVSPMLHIVYEPHNPIPLSGITLASNNVPLLAEYLRKNRASTYIPFEEVLFHSVNALDKLVYFVSPSLVRYA